MYPWNIFCAVIVAIGDLRVCGYGLSCSHPPRGQFRIREFDIIVLVCLPNQDHLLCVVSVYSLGH